MSDVNNEMDEGFCGFCGSNDMDPETLVPHAFGGSIGEALLGFICEDCLEVA